MMGHSLYHIAYSYYKDRFLRNNDKPTILGELFKRLLEQSHQRRSPPVWAGGFVVWPRGIVRRRTHATGQRVGTNAGQRSLPSCSRRPTEEDFAPHRMDERRTFHIACQVGQVLGYSFLRRFVELMRMGSCWRACRRWRRLGPVALSMAPYLAASPAAQRRGFSQRRGGDFAPVAPSAGMTPRKAWLTDTYGEVNGVSRTIQAMPAAARRMRRPLTVLTSAKEVPPTEADVKNFAPVGMFALPEYESQPVVFPPFLEVIEYIERHRFTELIISTPGPMGLTGLAAARLLGLKTIGIYHTDFVQYVRCLTQDDDLADLAASTCSGSTIRSPRSSFRPNAIGNT